MLRKNRAISIYLILAAFISFSIGNIGEAVDIKISESALLTEFSEGESKSEYDINPESFADYDDFETLGYSYYTYQQNIHFLHYKEYIQTVTYRSVTAISPSGRSPPCLS